MPQYYTINVLQVTNRVSGSLCRHFLTTYHGVNTSPWIATTWVGKKGSFLLWDTFPVAMSLCLISGVVETTWDGASKLSASHCQVGDSKITWRLLPWCGLSSRIKLSQSLTGNPYSQMLGDLHSPNPKWQWDAPCRSTHIVCDWFDEHYGRYQHVMWPLISGVSNSNARKSQINKVQVYVGHNPSLSPEKHVYFENIV